MPISKEKQALYAPDWKQISRRIRERGGGRCEGSDRYPDCRAAHGEPHPVTGSRVVLTTAHLNHDPTDNRPSNLASLCQRCHLTHDARLHSLNARETRRARSGQGKLIEEETG